MRTVHRNSAHAKRKAQANPTAWIETIAGNRQQVPDNATRIMNKIRTAFELLKTGTTDCQQFDRLAAAFNVGLIRAEAIDPLAEQTMQAGADAMRRCDDIFGRHGKYGFHGPDLVAMGDALDLYEDILRLSTPKMMVDALEEAARRMLQGACA